MAGLIWQNESVEICTFSKHVIKSCIGACSVWTGSKNIIGIQQDLAKIYIYKYNIYGTQTSHFMLCEHLSVVFVVKTTKWRRYLNVFGHGGIVFTIIIVLPRIDITWPRAKVYFTDTGNMHCQCQWNIPWPRNKHWKSWGEPCIIWLPWARVVGSAAGVEGQCVDCHNTGALPITIYLLKPLFHECGRGRGSMCRLSQYWCPSYHHLPPKAPFPWHRFDHARVDQDTPPWTCTQSMQYVR